MKNLSYYKSLYKKARTQTGKTKAFNRAVLNLCHEDKEKFIKWQVELMEN